MENKRLYSLNVRTLKSLTTSPWKATYSTTPSF